MCCDVEGFLTLKQPGERKATVVTDDTLPDFHFAGIFKNPAGFCSIKRRDDDTSVMTDMLLHDDHGGDDAEEED